MSHKLNRTFEEKVVAWLSAITSLEVVAEQHRLRNPDPDADFVSYNVQAPIRYGQDELVYKSGNAYYVKGIRSVPVDITIYSDSALEKGMALDMSLDMPTIWETYFNGYGFLRTGGLLDISGALETGYEKRCQLTIYFTIGFTVEDANVGYIEQVILNGTEIGGE